jgi:hypothetical protein
LAAIPDWSARAYTHFESLCLKWARDTLDEARADAEAG